MELFTLRPQVRLAQPPRLMSIGGLLPLAVLQTKVAPPDPAIKEGSYQPKYRLTAFGDSCWLVYRRRTRQPGHPSRSETTSIYKEQCAGARPIWA